MAVAKYKLQRGSGSGDWYSWDGDMLHLPVEVSSGVGADVTSIVGTTATTLTTTGFDNLVTTIKANRAAHTAIDCATLAGNVNTVADVQSLLDELIVHTD